MSTAKEKTLAASASKRIGRAIVQREAPAALITASSESVFMTLSVCATATTSANGTTIGTIEGMIKAATSKKVSVQGVEGIFVGDSTGLGSAVIWQKDGIVYGVAGTLTEQQVLAVANSLH